MTFDEFGRLAKQSPEFSMYSEQELARIPNRIFALKVLEKHPEYWDMISPTAKRVKQVSDRDTTPSYGPIEDFFTGTTKRLEDERRIIDNNLAEAQSLSEMDAIIEAASRNVPREALTDYILNEQQATLQIRVAAALAEIQSATEERNATKVLEFARRLALVEAEVAEIRSGRLQQNALPEGDGQES
ncbi:MAG: hypothetical protein A3I61_11130 [Acidobacteria bacterium RIFCSPLOWO2_02_FULL_68_18]|nr:MAG: hypothetical protein A3I61_11130 [Acidobacteria bacterium RIFCSPLOWO2_02_FULL_68_18]OFW50623.1 MAG: hypothetical protein A3G77_16875 [Acidobacteria bacterium RIFCSPLOWO2_12_FULL_68_19]